MKKLYAVINTISIKVFILIIILVLPLNIFSIMETKTAMDATLEQTELMEWNLMDETMANLTVRRNNMQLLLFYFLQRDSDCIKMRLSKEKDSEYILAKLKLFGKMKTMARMTSGADGYFYYTKNTDDFLFYSTEKSQTIAEIRQFIAEQAEKGQNTGWNICKWNGGQYLFMLGNVKDIAYGGWIYLDDIVERLYDKLHYKDCEVKFSLQKPNDDPEEISAVSENEDIFLSIYINRYEILQDLSQYHGIQRMISWLYLLVIPILFMLLKWLLLKPLFCIKKAHRELQNGNFAYRIGDYANSTEYEEVFHSFNNMAEHIVQLKIEAYEKEIARQKMELRNLQLQIRPHFLLNTFNLIYALAQKEEKNARDGLCDVILYLSDYFRYIFRNDKELELFSKEEHMLRGYTRMIEIRYQGRIKIHLDFESELMFVRIPPLLILNFVENSVRYGLKKDCSLNIEVSGMYDKGAVEFSIYDDGNGMSESILKKNQDIFAGRIEPDDCNSHVGLYNSLKRLRYFYGSEASVEVTSEEGVETEFIIRFPYPLEVDDESFNC